jgi:hypothetical protein
MKALFLQSASGENISRLDVMLDSRAIARTDTYRLRVTTLRAFAKKTNLTTDEHE